MWRVRIEICLHKEMLGKRLFFFSKLGFFSKSLMMLETILNEKGAKSKNNLPV